MSYYAQMFSRLSFVETSLLRPSLWKEFIPTKPNAKAIGRSRSAETQTCTGDARLFRPALYYLSYLGNMFKDRGTFYIRNNWNVNIEDFFVFLYNSRL